MIYNNIITKIKMKIVFLLAINVTVRLAYARVQSPLKEQTSVKTTEKNECSMKGLPNPESECCGRHFDYDDFEDDVDDGEPEVNDITSEDEMSNIINNFNSFSTYFDTDTTNTDNESTTTKYDNTPLPASEITIESDDIYFESDVNKDTEGSLNETSIARKRTPKAESDILPDKFISGGSSTHLNQFPWLVYIKIYEEGSWNQCGGTLIAPHFVLTAAHCVNIPKIRNRHVKIYLGEYDLDTFPFDCVNDKCSKNIKVYPNNIKVHENYNDITFENDIALLRLRKAAPFTDSIRPICLPPFNIENHFEEGTLLTVAGWGASEKEWDVYIKRSVQIKFVPRAKCVEMRSDLPKDHICAGDESGKDTCEGDSGGPLMISHEGKYYVAGLTSFGPDVPCGESKIGFYTNVYKYFDWIKNNTAVY